MLYIYSPGQFVTIFLPGTSRTLTVCEITVKSLVHGLMCSTNIDNTFYQIGQTYQLMCPDCPTTGILSYLF